MDLHTPVCDLLCCHEPIVLAGMGRDIVHGFLDFLGLNRKALTPS